jgi:cyclopropane-fatty-acyl-phospholipid synthase
LPSVAQLVKSVDSGSRGTLTVDDIKNIGPHYAKTLRIWGENFDKNFDEHIRPALKLEHKEMSEEDVELFKRKWEYYFTYCEAAFATKTLGDVIITVAREGTAEIMEDVPL